jgi:hypothetical protein
VGIFHLYLFSMGFISYLVHVGFRAGGENRRTL